MDSTNQNTSETEQEQNPVSEVSFSRNETRTKYLPIIISIGLLLILVVILILVNDSHDQSNEDSSSDDVSETVIDYEASDDNYDNDNFEDSKDKEEQNNMCRIETDDLEELDSNLIVNKSSEYDMTYYIFPSKKNCDYYGPSSDYMQVETNISKDGKSAELHIKGIEQIFSQYEVAEVLTFSEKVDEAFIGLFGQDSADNSIFFRRTDGRVEFLNIERALMYNETTPQVLENVENVVKFEHGEVFYSIDDHIGGGGRDTYAIRDDGKYYDLYDYIKD